MRFVLMILAVCAASCSRPFSPSSSIPAAADPSVVRRALERRYEENVRAFLAKDLAAIMALRTEDFHSVTPDGAVHDRAAMEQRTLGFLNGIDRWIATSFEIDSLEISGDLARAVVRQHADRMALREDGLVHHVETWVVQSETWRRTAEGWKLYRVDGIRDQRRLIDGEPR